MQNASPSVWCMEAASIAQLLGEAFLLAPYPHSILGFCWAHCSSRHRMQCASWIACWNPDSCTVAAALGESGNLFPLQDFHQ